MDNRISVIAVGEYDPAALYEAMERHFDLLGVWENLRPGMRVVLKPNLLARYAPDRAVTTHPGVVEAVARVLKAHGVDDITLADSPGGPYSAALLQGIYTTGGMAGAAERAGFRLNADTGWRELACPAEAVACRSFNIIDPVADADFVINLCKLKTHAMATLSGAVKNLFGCVPGLQKSGLHFRFPEKERFCRMLVDLALLVKPGLSIADAVVAMEGNGPAGGEPRFVGQTLAAMNPHLLDRALIDLIGLPPEAVFTVAHGIASGLCPGDIRDIRWLGDGRPEPVAGFRYPASKPLSFEGHVPAILRRPLLWAERTLLSPCPAIVKRACIGCGKCAESCAPGAIAIREGKARIDYGRCIKCFCCQEMCPVKAVCIRRTGIFRR